MKALIVTDMQKVITEFKDFSETKANIHRMIDAFKENGETIVFTRHISQDPEDYFYVEKESTAIDYKDLEGHTILEKTTPSIFKDTHLDEDLRKKGIDELVVVGFNTEYCTLFSSIAAFDRGYKVTFIEDAIGTCNNDETYEMPGLDINDFVGSFLNWSGAVEVLYTDEYFEE